MNKPAWLVLVCALALAPVASDLDPPTWTREKTEPDPSQGATVAQVIGVDTWVQFTYHRPGVKGRNVWEDKSDMAIIGALVPRYGEPRPWRAGANEATTVRFTGDVKIEGTPLAAGHYAFFVVPTDGAWTLIFQDDVNQWGSFRYEPSKDVLRVDVTPVQAPHAEWLAYGFDDPGPWSTTAWLHWEKVKLPFRVEVDRDI